MGSSQSTTAASEGGAGANKKQSLYERYQTKKRGQGPSDEDIQKYLGKSRDELNKWAETRPGVGGNQLAGSATAGPTSGLGGVAMADGYGGWGPGAAPKGEDRGLKFPPKSEVAKDATNADTVKKADG